MCGFVKMCKEVAESVWLCVARLFARRTSIEQVDEEKVEACSHVGFVTFLWSVSYADESGVGLVFKHLSRRGQKVRNEEEINTRY